MGIYIYKKVLSPEFVFELHQDLPAGVEIGKVTVINEQQAIAAIIVEDTSLKKAKQQARALIEDRMRQGTKHEK